MEYGCIYKHTNLINGFSYIGQTTNDPVRRWRTDGEGYKNSTYFYNAIKKYGWNNFSHEIIEDNIPIDNLNERESYWIKYYHTYRDDPDCKGYNLTIGGNEHTVISEEVRNKMSKAAKNRVVSNETRAKLSKIRKGRKLSKEIIEKILTTKANWTEDQKQVVSQKLRDNHKYKPISEETRRKISEAHKGQKQSKESIKKMLETRSKWSDEYKESLYKKISGKTKGMKRSEEFIVKNILANLNPIKCLENNIIYRTMEHASRELGISRSTVERYLNNKTKQKKYHFERLSEEEFAQFKNELCNKEVIRNEWRTTISRIQ